MTELELEQYSQVPVLEEEFIVLFDGVAIDNPLPNVFRLLQYINNRWVISSIGNNIKEIKLKILSDSSINGVWEKRFVKLYEKGLINIESTFITISVNEVDSM